jgi:hypothetical protein
MKLDMRGRSSWVEEGEDRFEYEEKVELDKWRR